MYHNTSPSKFPKMMNDLHRNEMKPAWSSRHSIRHNQDNQRDFEEIAFQAMSEILSSEKDLQKIIQGINYSFGTETFETKIIFAILVTNFLPSSVCSWFICCHWIGLEGYAQNEIKFEQEKVHNLSFWFWRPKMFVNFPFFHKLLWINVYYYFFYILMITSCS